MISLFIAGVAAGLCDCSCLYSWGDKCGSHDNPKSINIQLWPCTQISQCFVWWNAQISNKLLVSDFLSHTCCCSYGTQLFVHVFIFSAIEIWVNADGDFPVKCVIFTQMEDPSLLEESSTLIDPSDPHRTAPLRLGSAHVFLFCLFFFFSH